MHKSVHALYGCEFVQSNHPTYSPDVATGDDFLFGNPKSHPRGTWYAESVKIAVEAWFDGQDGKLCFQGVNSLEEQ